MGLFTKLAACSIAAGFIYATISPAIADTQLCSKKQDAWVTVALKSTCVEDRCPVSAEVRFEQSVGNGYYCGTTAYSGRLCTWFFGRKLVFQGGGRVYLD